MAPLSRPGGHVTSRDSFSCCFRCRSPAPPRAESSGAAPYTAPDRSSTMPPAVSGGCLGPLPSRSHGKEQDTGRQRGGNDCRSQPPGGAGHWARPPGDSASALGFRPEAVPSGRPVRPGGARPWRRRVGVPGASWRRSVVVQGASGEEDPRRGQATRQEGHFLVSVGSSGVWRSAVTVRSTQEPGSRFDRHLVPECPEPADGACRDRGYD